MRAWGSEWLRQLIQREPPLPGLHDLARTQIAHRKSGCGGCSGRSQSVSSATALAPCPKSLSHITIAASLRQCSRNPTNHSSETMPYTHFVNDHQRLVQSPSLKQAVKDWDSEAAMQACGTGLSASRFGVG